MDLKSKAALLIASFLALSCAHTQERIAPFRGRPDSVKAGLLRGPFSGQVVSAAGGDPVAGALVYATWTYETGAGAPQPVATYERIVSTNAGGRYTIAEAPKRSDSRLTAFHLVVYKRGFVAYRSDRRFADFGPRRDFAQRENRVELARWNSDLSHARHLRYIGGGTALQALTSWELAPALEELSGGAPGAISSSLVAGASQSLVAAQLLGALEIKKITGFEGDFESGPLGDEPDTGSYSSQHFKALGQPEFFDVAIRLWRAEEAGAESRFEELLSSLPGVSERDEVGDRALLALEGDIQGYAFLDRQRSIVVLITCGKGQCQEVQHLTAIARKVHENLTALIPSRRTTPKSGEQN